MTVYESLAVKIEIKIRNGLLLPGQKLPSVRDLSSNERVSPATVVEAYELLRDRGMIESRERSGYFVLQHQKSLLDPIQKTASFIPAIDANPNDLILAIRLASDDAKVFPFGAATPIADYFPDQAIQRTIAKVIREEPTILSDYRFPPGSIRLRDQVADRYARLGVKMPLDSVVTTTGAIEAIGLSLSAIETPAFFGILQLVKSMGYKVLEIPLEAERGLTPVRLQQAIVKSGGKLKAVVTVSSFSNPIGSCVPDDQKTEIVQIAARAGVVLIEDDIYGDLYFEGKRPKPYQAFDPGDTVITCGSFSKTLSPSLRVGFACSKKYAPAIAFLKAARSSGVSALAEESIAAYLETDQYERHLKFLRKEYKTLLSQYSAAILAHFPEGTKISQPKGGFVLWVQLPKGVDSRELQRRALQARISIAPGPIFSASYQDYENFIRLNCAIPWSPRSQKAVMKLAGLVEEQLKRS
jgi:DNA-binding transcriptional MocR family regulator